MRILITGGIGFIGYNLCQRLLQKGHNIVCLDDISTGLKQNLNRLKSFNNFEFINHDVALPFMLECDQIYNLACPASPVHYQLDPIKTIKTSVYGAFNTLEIALKNNIKILQASTSEIYGNPMVHPQKEDYWGNVNTRGLRSCYDEGKRCAEAIFFDYHRKYGVDIRVIRIFNTYGPYMSLNDNRVIPNFICQALQNKDILIFGTGHQTRSFQYIDDLLNAMIIMMQKPNLNGPVNIGNPNEISIKNLANLIIDLTGSSSKIKFLPLPQDDPEKRCPDISLAKEKLNWEPLINLKEGILKTIPYFESALRLNKV